ncbi:hypothetical protein B0H14DRAFT_3489320 [Mycena olivaceomarginata]|nr:hypothetical protein B0H14DRAFT_3489320 [Mycena olivaceomarginata]
MCFSLALAAFAAILSVYAANIPIEVGANNEGDGASILSSVASDVTGAVPIVTSAVASAVKEATSALPSDVTSAVGGAINTATSVLPSVIGDVTSAAEGAFNTATSEIPNIISDATGVIGDATAAVGGLIGAGVRIDASALSLLIGVGITVILL